MANLGRAVLEFVAETAKFQSDVGRAAAVFERNMGLMTGALGTLRNSLIAAAGPTAMVALVKGAIDAGDHMYKLSQKIGITTEALSGLKLAAELGDVDFDTFTRGLKNFNVALIEASNPASKMSRIFTAMGVDATAGPKEAFRQFAESFSKLPEGELRTAAAMAVFKKSGLDMIPVLSEGAKGLDDAAEKADKLGLIISSDFGKKSQEFNDNVKLLTKGTTALGISIAENILPAIGEMAKNMAEGALKGEKWLSVLKEMAKLSIATGASITRNVPIVGALTDMAARAAFEKGGSLVSSGKIKVNPREFEGPQHPDPEGLRRALSESDSLQKRQIAAMQAMEEKKKSLFNLDERQLMLDRITNGTYKDFEPKVKAKLMGIAKEIDLRKQHIDIINMGIPAMQAEFDAQEKSDEILKSYYVSNKAQSDQMAFDIGLIGKTSSEQEKLNMLRQIDLNLLEKKRQIAAEYGENTPESMAQQARAEKEAARARMELGGSLDVSQQTRRNEAVRVSVESIEAQTAALGLSRVEQERIQAMRAIDMQQFGRVLSDQERSVMLTNQDVEARKRLIDALTEQQHAQRDGLTGAKQFFADYSDMVTDRASQMKMVLQDTFRGAEDALVNFVKTGKLSFTNLADSIIEDLIRIAIRQSITGPIAGWMGGMLGGAGGGGGMPSWLWSSSKPDGSSSAGAYGGMDNGAVANAQYLADGGPMKANSLAIVGESGPELLYSGKYNGHVFPNDMISGGGGKTINVYPDMRGASLEAVQQLQAVVQSLDASIESRAAAEITNLARRGRSFP